MFTWIIFSTQATQPKRDLPRLPFAAIPAPHVPSPVGFFLRFFSFHPFIFRSWSVPFFPIVGSASSFSAQRMWLRWGRPPPPPQLAVPYSSTHSDGPTSILLLVLLPPSISSTGGGGGALSAGPLRSAPPPCPASRCLTTSAFVPTIATDQAQ